MTNKHYLTLVVLMLHSAVVHSACTAVKKHTEEELPRTVSHPAVVAFDTILFANSHAQHAAAILAMSARYNTSQHPEVFAALHHIVDHRGTLTVKDLKAFATTLTMEDATPLSDLLGIKPGTETSTGFGPVIIDASDDRATSSQHRGHIVTRSDYRICTLPPPSMCRDDPV